MVHGGSENWLRAFPTASHPGEFGHSLSGLGRMVHGGML